MHTWERTWSRTADISTHHFSVTGYLHTPRGLTKTTPSPQAHKSPLVQLPMLFIQILTHSHGEKRIRSQWPPSHCHGELLV